MTSFSFTSTVATLTTGYMYRFQALGANSLSLPAHLIAADVTEGLHLLSRGEPSSDPSSKPCWLLSFDQTAQSEAARVRTFLRETPPAGLIVFHPFSVSGGLALAVEPDEAKSRQLVAVLQSLLCAEASDQALGHSGASSHHGDAEEKSADKSITAESFERDCAFVRTQWWHDDRNRLIELLNKEKGANAAAQFYVYSEKEVRANISRLRDEVTQVKRVFYAVKANCCKQLLLIAHEMGLGFECVSHNEIKLVFSLFPDLPADRILFTPNFAARTEYEAAYALGVHVNLDNVWPLTAWPEVFRGKAVMIRIDPGQGKGHHAHVRTGGARSKFGVSVDQLTAAKPVIDSLALKVVGLHVHAGSGILEHSNWADTAALLGSLKSNFPHLRYFDLGGGLGVPYRPTEKPLDLKALNQSLQQWRESHPLLADIELWLEPGRYIVATSGVLAASVTQLKHKPGKNFVGINTGMNSLIRPALYESYHHIVNLSRLDTQLSAPSALQLVDVVGPICETGDVLGRDRPLPVATSEGDWILVATAGAYGTAMSSQYNLRPPAEERMLATQ